MIGRPRSPMAGILHPLGDFVQYRKTIKNVLALAAALTCVPASALSFRAYLSTAGSDANPCTVSQPCRLLPAALNAIVDGGEVWMLDSANYNSGPVNLTKSVSILSTPGAVGSVVALNGPAFNLNTAGISVSLKNLVIVPFPASGGTDGIVVTDAASLTIQDTVIANMPGTGIIAFAPIRIKLVDSVVRGNYNGVHLQGGASVDIANSKIIGNFNIGVKVEGYGYTGSPSLSTAAITDSIVSANGIGLYAISTLSGYIARITAIRTSLSHNNHAFICQSGNSGTATCTLGYSMVNESMSVGLYQTGTSTFRSMSNNILVDNYTPIVGTITPLAGG
jgi:hypothetical protein